MAIENPDYNLAICHVDYSGGAPVYLRQTGFSAIARTAGEPVGVVELSGDLAGFGDNTYPDVCLETPGGALGAAQQGITAKIITVGGVKVIQVVTTTNPGGGGAIAKADLPFFLRVSRVNV